MSEAKDSFQSDENTSSTYGDNHELLKKKKRRNRRKSRNVESASLCNTNEHINREQSTSVNEGNAQNLDVYLSDSNVEEYAATARSGCFGKMFRYLKRKLFKNDTLCTQKKRAKLNDSKFESNSNNDENSSDTLVQKVICVKSESQQVDDENHFSKFSESEGSIVSSHDEIQQAQKRKRNRRRMPKLVKNNSLLRKYWKNRYSLFSKYDDGIKLDAESWYSVTPEKISVEIARRCQCDVIIDAFCGAGGNAIQFAFLCERVIAIDIDAKKVELAKHNAKIYGVFDRIEFIVGDFFQVAPSLKADVVFLSPPWGGPSYKDIQILSLNHIMEPHGGEHLYNVAKRISEHIAYFLPRNISIPEVARLEPDDFIKFDRNYLDKRLIAITAYFGDLIEDYGNEYTNELLWQ